MAPRGLLPALLLAFLLSPGVGTRPIAEFRETLAVVRSCSELRSAVENGAVVTIVVQGTVRCTRGEWDGPVAVKRSVEIVGEGESERLSGLDWGPLTKVLIAWGPGVLIRLRGLVLAQDDMGITGVDIAFMGTRQGAHLSMTRCVVNVRYCVTPVSALAPSLTERPGFAPGGQAASGNESEGVLRIGDVVLYWPGLDAVWTMCRSAFVCGATNAARLRGLMGEGERGEECFNG